MWYLPTYRLELQSFKLSIFPTYLNSSHDNTKVADNGDNSLSNLWRINNISLCFSLLSL